MSFQMGSIDCTLTVPMLNWRWLDLVLVDCMLGSVLSVRWWKMAASQGELVLCRMVVESMG